MSTPPPFGDPSAVQRENASAVGKGVMMGCGGCLALLAVPVVLVTVLFVGIFASLRMSQPCEDALRAAQASTELKKEIGDPLELAWRINGSLNTQDGKGRAELRMTVQGPQGEAEANCAAPHWTAPGPMKP
ncbi:MAG: hypothetical protein CJBNEKGG_00757 [Prosthecobacter sp.]|nr:hypothetical protein [Prosthecobacter sp.]